ncbi:MAG: type II toxin-antitoxin system RelE/ParE family toxin [Oscillospiraceae bacterium]|nr:type II toxin-antitoxin system RelE/ParE family toxin [Oscillospiraceae bacterium]
MIYEVKLNEDAEQDLREIYRYIALSLLEPEIASNINCRIVAKLMSLNHTPERYPIYQVEPWKSRKLRRINIGNYSGFYYLTENAVEVIRILYGGRNISTILNESTKTE